MGDLVRFTTVASIISPPVTRVGLYLGSRPFPRGRGMKFHWIFVDGEIAEVVVREIEVLSEAR